MGGEEERGHFGDMTRGELRCAILWGVFFLVLLGLLVVQIAYKHGTIKAPSPPLFRSDGPLIDTRSDVAMMHDERAYYLRAMTYNIREGARGAGLKEKLVQYIQSQQVDLLALQELNGWDTAMLQRYAQQWGHEHVVFLTARTGYHLGLTSRLPFEVIRTRLDGFWHGMIHVRFLPGPETVPGWRASESEGEAWFDDQHDEDEDQAPLEEIETEIDPSLHVIVTHLDPHNQTHRYEEAHHIDRQSREHAHVMVMGDLNALSPWDDVYYNENGLLEILQQDAHLINKFLYRPLPGADWALDYRVMEELYQEGRLTDLDHQFQHSFRPTVPTDSNEDASHAAHMRLDYLLVTEDLAHSCVLTAIHDTPDTNLISDHYPLMVEFQF